MKKSFRMASWVTLGLLGAAWMAGMVQADIIKPAGPIPIVAGTTSTFAHDPSGLLTATEFGSPYTGADAVPYATVPLMSFGANPNFGQADVWYGPSGDVNAKDWIAVDLGQTYDLTDMYLWEGYQDGWRPLTFSLYKLDSMPTTGADAPAGTLIKTWTGAQWTGGSWGGPHPGKDYVFDNTVNAQYLMLKMVTAENGGSFTEVRFVGTPASPPPTTTTTAGGTTTTTTAGGTTTTTTAEGTTTTTTAGGTTTTTTAEGTTTTTAEGTTTTTTAGGTTTTTTVTTTTTTTTTVFNPTILPATAHAQSGDWGAATGTLDGTGLVPPCTGYYDNPLWDGPHGPAHNFPDGAQYTSNPGLVTSTSVLGINGHSTGFGGWVANFSSGARWIAFDLGGNYDLTKIDFWNLDGNEAWLRSVQNMDVYIVSALPDNGVSLATALGTPEAGPTPITGIARGTPWCDGMADTPNQQLTYSASNARYVLFNVTANYGDPGVVGICEVRFEGTLSAGGTTTTTTAGGTTTTTAAEGTTTTTAAGGTTTTTTVTTTTTTTTTVFNPTILPATAHAQSGDWGAATGTLDGTGLVPPCTGYYDNPLWDGPHGPAHNFPDGAQYTSNPGLVTSTSVLGINGHSTGFGGWVANFSSGARWIAFDLGGNYDLTKIDFWNLDGNEAWLRSVQNMDVYIVSALPDNGVSLATALGTPEAGPTPITGIARGTPWCDGMADTPNQQLTYSASNARYVLFNVTANYGDPGVVGICEVRFEGTLSVGGTTTTTTTTAGDTTTTTTVAATTTTTTTALLATSIGMQAGKPVVGWNGATSWFYTVEFTPSLFPFTQWSNVTDYVLVPGVNGPMSALDTNVLRQGFYRIRMTQ